MKHADIIRAYADKYIHSFDDADYNDDIAAAYDVSERAEEAGERSPYIVIEMHLDGGEFGAGTLDECRDICGYGSTIDRAYRDMEEKLRRLTRRGYALCGVYVYILAPSRFGCGLEYTLREYYELDRSLYCWDPSFPDVSDIACLFSDVRLAGMREKCLDGGEFGAEYFRSSINLEAHATQMWVARHYMRKSA